VREGGEPNTPLTALVGIVFAIVLFVVVVFLQAFFYQQQQAENARKVVAVAPEQLSQLRSQQLGELHGYRWVDEKAGIVAIPIGRAMELVVRDGGRSPWPSVQPPPPSPPPTPPPHPAVPKR
jgi:type II secretory pathway pseudopilin PulG